MEQREVSFVTDEHREFAQVKVYPDEEYQTVLGMGGAFTESSGYVYSLMNDEAKEKLIRLYFGKDGNRYNFCRTHIESCDFSLGNYDYISDPGDRELSGFTLERDEKYILPLIDAALSADKDIRFMASPWSPPAFMKSNGDRNHGGKLLEEYADMYADLIAKYVSEYAKKGIKISRLSVQNEPAATQTWDSCLYSGEEESRFVIDHLRPALKKQGFEDIRINIWDHNKDKVVERVKDSFSVDGAMENIGGIAFHWYTGDHFDALRWVREKYPDKELIHTEGCVEYSRFDGGDDLKHAEMYAHDIIGNFQSGMNGYIDWNLYLDEKGGPNHVGNFCGAPVMCDTKTGEIEVKLSYYYIGHFSRFIMPGAKRILTSVYDSRLECCGFKNPDGSCVVTVLNRSDEDIKFNLALGSENAETVQKGHSIITFVIE